MTRATASGTAARDAGYTLGEVLIALFVIGLAMGGLATGVSLVARQQARAMTVAHDARSLRAVHESLDRFLEGQGPFVGPGSEVFEGTSESFHFHCGVDDDCRVWLASAPGGMALHFAGPGVRREAPLPGVRSAQFVYAGSRTIGPVWPADAQTVQPLKSIGLMAETSAGSIPLANVRLWIDQSPYCDFDAILKDCRR
jgi:hypothetical protein